MQSLGDLSIPNQTSRKTILVVEDDEDVRTFAVELLGGLGYNVLAAADGAAALNILDDNPDIGLLSQIASCRAA